MALARYYFVVPSKVLNALVVSVNGTFVLALYSYLFLLDNKERGIIVLGHYKPQVLEPCYSPDQTLTL